jgi:DNA polymerase III delta subunit
MAAGNALAVVEATDPRDMRHGPKVKRLSDAIEQAGGTVQAAAARGPTGLGAWIETEARDRGQALGPGAARELAVRLGARVTEGDVDRRYLTAIAASELDKLALRHALDGEPVTVADVQALVAETTPGSIFALSDAIGERRVEAALTTLDRVLDGTAETYLLVILHRRIAELLEMGDRLASGANVATVARAMRIGSSFRAGRLAEQARNWTTAELRDALAGLVELDAMIKGAPGSTADAAQRRLAFVLWVRRHAARAATGRHAVGAGAGAGRAR